MQGRRSPNRRSPPRVYPLQKPRGSTPRRSPIGFRPETFERHERSLRKTYSHAFINQDPPRSKTPIIEEYGKFVDYVHRNKDSFYLQ